MTDERPSPDVPPPIAEPAWGSPQPRGSWSPKLTLAAVGVAALIAGVGGAAIYAATEGAHNDIGRGMHGPGMPGMPGPPPGPGGFGPPPAMGPPPPMAGPGGPGMGGPGGPPPGMPPAPPLHGQFVVPDGNGGYVTRLTQTGVLTAVSDTEITAKSPDGFTQTYARGPNSFSPNAQLVVDDTVTIHATLAGDKATADAIFAGSAGGPGGPPPGRSPRPRP